MEGNQNYTNKGAFVTPNIFEGLSDKELFEILKESQKAGAIAFMLKEIVIRQQTMIIDMKNRIAMLEEKTIKAKGRKKTEFYLNGRLLTDDEIIRLIDGEYFDSIGKLEKEVGAGKNQLRNRYNKEKRRIAMLEQQQKDDNE